MVTIQRPSSSICSNHPFLHSRFQNSNLSSKIALPFSRKSSPSLLRSYSYHVFIVCNVRPTSSAENGPWKCSDVLVKALEREGVTVVFADRGSTEIHKSLERSENIRNVLLSRERAEVFAAGGYARASGTPGVCIATSMPDAKSGLLHNCVPIVAITSAFPETRRAEPTTKHNWLAKDAEDIPRIVREAFFLAKSGRPGPVLIEVPEDILHKMVVPDWSQPISPAGYPSGGPDEKSLKEILGLIGKSKKPVLYVGGGCLNSIEEVRTFVGLTGIPVASTLMGLGAKPVPGEEFPLHMLGMDGAFYANYAVEKSDLLLAFGVRFHDEVTEWLEAFASRAQIVHIDNDSAEIQKNNLACIRICADIKLAFDGFNSMLHTKKNNLKMNFLAWRRELKEQQEQYRFTYKTSGDTIPPQYAIQALDELINKNTIIITGVEQHKMWAAQSYKYNRPRHWLTSGGLGVRDGFGLPVSIGAAVAGPDAVVGIDEVTIFLPNVDELEIVRVKKLPVKIMVLNHPTNELKRFPNTLELTKNYGIRVARVTKKKDLTDAIRKMLHTPGPYVLDVIVPS